MSPRFDEVRRLADLEKKATPGPWFQENCIYQWDLYAVNHDLEPSPAHPWKLISADKNGYYPPESDAELIPSIRNAARWLTEVAGCFQPGDANEIAYAIDVLIGLPYSQYTGDSDIFASPSSGSEDHRGKRMTPEDIKEFRNDWYDEDLKDEIDRRILNPLEDFEKFLENEIESLEVNSQFEAMRVKIILTEFREKFR